MQSKTKQNAAHGEFVVKVKTERQKRLQINKKQQHCKQQTHMYKYVEVNKSWMVFHLLKWLRREKTTDIQIDRQTGERGGRK